MKKMLNGSIQKVDIISEFLCSYVGAPKKTTSQRRSQSKPISNKK